MRKKSAKKLTAAVIIAAAMAMATACGSDKAENGAASEETTAGEGNESGESESLGEIKLGEYKGIELEAQEPHTVTDEETDSYIEAGILPYYKESVTDAIKEGDVVNIDYIGRIDGEAFDGGSAEGFDLTIGSGRFIDGFEDGLIGYKKGDKADINVTFPDPYENNPDLAGKPAVFEVTVNDVTRTPELTDELAAELDPECKTASEYRKKIKELLQENMDFSARQSLIYDATNIVVGNSEITPTKEAVDRQVEESIEALKTTVPQTYGVSFEDMLSQMDITEDEYKESIRPVAEESVKQLMVYDEIAKLQNMVVSDGDIDDFADKYSVSKDELLEAYSEEDVEERVLREKAMDFIIDNAVITYISADDASGFAEGAAEAENGSGQQEAEGGEETEE